MRDARERRMFTNLHHNMCEYGLLQGNRQSGRWPRVTRTFSIGQNVLDTVRRNLSINVRTVTATVGGSLSVLIVFCNVKKGKPLHSYHLQRVPSQIVMRFSKHLLVWCISLRIPFVIQSFCCSCISFCQSVNQMHIHQLSVHKTAFHSSEGDDSSNSCGNVGLFPPMFL
ncbi:hypothetical protein TNCV_3139511 [Trichonephila clavipes]|nr:hypothetical protein TNCV_3139511 [Trichonephila clavipes]